MGKFVQVGFDICYPHKKLQSKLAMDSFKSGSVWYSKLESEVLMADLYQKLRDFPDNEKTRVVISWLGNSFGDLTNSGSLHEDSKAHFIVHIKLLNTLVNNSSFEVAHELSDIFSRDFLQAFVKPALLDVSHNRQSNAAEATYYFQLVCENVSNTLLIRKIIKFTISFLIPTLLARLKCTKQGNSEVLTSTLGLFGALLEFYCEDLWHELLLQYLLPMKHFLVSERQKAIPEIALQESASRFLDIIPSSMHNAFTPEMLSEHFILYTQQELERIKKTDVTISKAVPLSKSEVTGIPMIEVVDVETSEQERSSLAIAFGESSRNTTYPMWIFKYDGTDVLHATRKYKLSEPEEYFEDDLFQFVSVEDRDLVSPATLRLSENTSEDENELDDKTTATLHLPEGPEPLRFYAEPVVTSMHVRESPSQDQNLQRVEDQGYFGPFLESLFSILNNWTWLEPDATVMISDLFSVLASSRIPLITSILLDFSIVIQPCFPSFQGTLHSIRTKLDGSMKKYPEAFVRQIWRKTAGDTSNFEEEEDLSLNNSEGSFADTLRRKIIKSNPFSFVKQISNNQPGGSAFSKFFGNTSSQNRILNKSAEWFANKEDELVAKNTTLRCLVFSHWMLELSAISVQSGWSQSRPTQREEVENEF